MLMELMGILSQLYTRRYGQRQAKRKTEALVREVEMKVALGDESATG